MLNLLKNTVPLVGLILGIIALVAGFLLSRGKREESVDFDEYEAEWDDETEVVPAVAPAVGATAGDGYAAGAEWTGAQTAAGSDAVHDTAAIPQSDDLIPGMSGPAPDPGAAAQPPVEGEDPQRP
jgi:hypothetical protein